MGSIREAELGDYYREPETIEFIKSVKAGDSSLLISFPGCGKSSFLKFIICNKKIKTRNPKVKFLYIDLNDLPKFEPVQLYKLILNELCKEVRIKKIFARESEELLLVDQIKEVLKKLTEKYDRIVLIFDRFDKVFANFPFETFNTLRSIRDGLKNNVVYAVSSYTDPLNIASLAKIQTFYKIIVSSVIYVKPLSDRDFSNMLLTASKDRGVRLSKNDVELIKRLTGNHPSLTKPLLKIFADCEISTRKRLSFLDYEPISSTLTEIYESLSTSEKEVVRMVLKKGATLPEKPLKSLKNLGILIEKEGKIQFFSTLFEDFIKMKFVPENSELAKNGRNIFDYDSQKNLILKNGLDISVKLTRQEFELLRHLIQNSDKVFKRDEISTAVWGKDSLNGVTDEAIDQVISRLRGKIEDTKKTRYLITLRGIGFKFTNPKT